MEDTLMRKERFARRTILLSTFATCLISSLAWGTPNAGSLVGWGDNFYGDLTVPAGNDFLAVAAGDNFSLALRTDGSLAGWGYDASGQANVPTGNYFVAVAAGRDFSLALKTDGSLAGWGRN